MWIMWKLDRIGILEKIVLRARDQRRRDSRNGQGHRRSKRCLFLPSRRRALHSKSAINRFGTESDKSDKELEFQALV